MKLVFCFPGQGSQEVGMGRELAEAVPEARAVFETAAEAAGFDVAAACFEGPIERLTRTDVQQPALVATSLACLAAVEAAGVRPDAVVGHSVGEYSALAACGALTLRDTIVLVAARGTVTAAVAAEVPGAMAAVIGLGDDEVERLCEEVGGVWPANYNCPGQIVVSGRTSSVDRLLVRAAEHGARRTVRLRVGGAFHSPLVAAAAERLRPAVAATPFAEPTTAFMSTVTAQLEPTERLAELLLEQLTAPVRFTQAVRELVAAGVDTFVELGPGHVLSGLVKRIDRSVRAISVGDLSGLAGLSELVQGARA